jgi:hypothetical protein
MSDEQNNVVEVDFARKRGDDDDSIVAQIREALDGLKGALAEVRWVDAQRRLERRRSRELEKELNAERDRAFGYTDADVHRALERVYDGSPVAATAVANALTSNLTHSIVVRTGRALSRLAGDGRVEKVAPSDVHASCRWSPRAA